MQKEWFKAWFGTVYQKLYTHRDLHQAQEQVKMLLGALPKKTMRILDIGCGSGRHLECLRRTPHQAVGLDLSSTLLKECRTFNLPVLRADMRRLPFPAQSFDLLTNFFTSFGYFLGPDEDLQVLRGFIGLIRPSGYLFLDLMNAEFIKKTLVSEETRQLPDMRVNQKRRLENGGKKVVKEIHILFPDGREEKHSEQVNLYTLQEMQVMTQNEGLHIEQVFGNEKGDCFNAMSPRMSLLCKKVK